MIGVVADDITGANDIGIMFAKAGYLVHVYAHASFTGVGPRHQAPDVAILDTNSRLDPASAAYEKVHTATLLLQAAGCRQFYNKTCSVFRGNIGAEFDAMLDALSAEFAIVVLGFPKNGRQTIDGIHYVHGRRLEESQFRHDPVHPMTSSHLVEILGAQTRRSVALLDRHVVAQGAEPLRAAIEQLRSRCNYLILDVVDQAALATIARAVHDERVLCGSSALAEELPAVWSANQRAAQQAELPPRNGMGILCAAGSLMPQTLAQIEHLRQQGVATFELDTLQIFEPQQRRAAVERLTASMVQTLRQGQDVLLHSPNQPARVEQTRTAGAVRGFSATEAARQVSATIAEVVAQASERAGQSRLLIAGGETSAAVCARLGITGVRVWQEIQPGLPSCISLTTPPRLLVLKSGSFGGPDFFQQAIEHLQAQ